MKHQKNGVSNAVSKTDVNTKNK